jgi:nucleotide-binding universal stress UspA family protein
MYGDPGECIVREATAEHVVMVVMTTHARSGMRRAVVGSVAEYVVAHSPAPTLLVRGGCRLTPQLKTVLLAIDNSVAAALLTTIELARACGARVVLFRAVDFDATYVWQWSRGPVLEEPQAVVTAWQQLNDLATRMRGDGVSTEARVQIGETVPTIVSVAADVGADLIVMTTHARTGAQRAIQGSVADAVMRLASQPVLLSRLVPPPPASRGPLTWCTPSSTGTRLHRRRAGFVHAPLPDPCVPPRCRPARSSFFRAGVRIVDLDLAPFALADDLASLAPGPVALPGDTCVVEHRPDSVVLTLGKPSGARRRARCKVFNDQVAVPSRLRSGGRRNSARIRLRSSGPYRVGGRPPACRSTAARPTWLNRVTHAATESPRARPKSWAAAVYELPSLTASSARARATDNAGALRLRANCSNDRRSELVSGRSGCFLVRLTTALLGQSLETAPGGSTG